MAWTGAAISGGASLLSGVLGGFGSSDAADAQAQAAKQAQLQQSVALNRQLEAQRPFQQTGVRANSKLAELLGIDSPFSGELLTGADADKYEKNRQIINQATNLNASSTIYPNVYKAAQAAQAENAQFEAKWRAANPRNESTFGSLLRNFTTEDLNNDPVYKSGLQFGLDQGTGAINSRAIANGSYDSGATLKELTRYATDYGSTKANESWNRFQNQNANIYNRLAGLSGSGQQATNNVTSAVGNYGNNVSNLIADAGNARAAGIMGGANAWGNALGGVSNAVNSYYSNKNFNDWLNKKG